MDKSSQLRGVSRQNARIRGVKSAVLSSKNLQPYQRVSGVGYLDRHPVIVEYSTDMELGHWVTGSMGHLSRPGHRVIILTRCETRVFPDFEKNQDKDIYYCENSSNRH